MTNILLFPGSLSSGGIEKHNYHLLRYINREKFNIHLALFEGAQNMFGEIPNDVKQLSLPRSYAAAGKVLSSYIKKEKINVVYSCSFETSMPLFFVKLNLIKFRLVLGRRGFMAYTLKRKVFDWMFQLLADKIICNSYKVRSSLSWFGKQKARVIYNTLDDTFTTSRTQEELRSEYGFSSVDFVIGTVGRLSKDKGQEYLIQAFSELADQNDGLRLLLIGDGELKENLEVLVREKNIESKVVFAGNKINGGDYAKAMDLFVLPSLTESMPNALLESLFLGIPSISTKVGGVPEIITHQKNGLLIDEVANSKEIKEKIKSILNNEVDADEIGRSGQEMVMDRFSLKKNLKLYENEFH